MQNESRGTKNLMEIVEEHMEGDVVVRCKVYEDHNSEEFKEMNKRFKESVRTYWNDDRDLGYLSDRDKATLREKYYNFEL
ncbi:hypothetical protein [uncultured Clostridium sp.]|uniref:hypothetical protein n=1 Tax=uncultured Clostridium sp. TaxID=59620 RepID=UPI003217C952